MSATADKKKTARNARGRGCKYNEKTKQRALALIADGLSIREVAGKMAIPQSTIKSWKKESLECEPEELSRIRLEHSVRYAKEAFAASDKAMALTQRALDRAMTQDKLLDELIEKAERITGDKGINDREFAEFVRRVNALKLEDASKCASISAQMFDKASLASGGVTERIEAEVKPVRFEDL